MVMGSRSAHLLPVRLTPFVGRDTDLKRILDLIQIPGIWLITIVEIVGLVKLAWPLDTSVVLNSSLS